ncbi:unnamed protein product, partial [Polarella glacialis]
MAVRPLLCSSRAGLDFGLRCGRRSFGWSAEDTELKFRVSAEGVNLPKLAGGISMRTEQRMQTFLEAAGERSIYNCIKALVLVNRFAQKRREDAANDSSIEVPWFHRVAFVPSFGKNGTMEWMRLRVIGLPLAPAVFSESLGVSTLKVSSKTPPSALERAILNEWLQRCAGTKGDPRLAGMGATSISASVKASAFCLKELTT